MPINIGENSQIPIKSQMVPKKRKNWSKRLIVTSICILLVLNIGAVYFIYYKAKVLADSASTAAQNTETFSGYGKGLDLPTADVAGDDIEGIGRYKSSVRTKYTKENNQTIVEYQTKDTAKLVLGYFKTELANSGWILQEANNESITFAKGNIFVSITTSENNVDKITTYKIIY